MNIEDKNLSLATKTAEKVQSRYYHREKYYRGQKKDKNTIFKISN